MSITKKTAEQKRESRSLQDKIYRSTHRASIKVTQDKWLAQRPWYRKYVHAYSRCKNDPNTWQYKRNLPFTCKPADFKKAWEDSDADHLMEPSVNRIKPHLGYIPGNIEFIELVDNLNCKRSAYWKCDRRGHAMDI